MVHRVIARLDIKGPNLVKGIRLEGLRVLGDPAVFAAEYYKAGADELLYQDTVASLYGRNSLHDLISRAAKEIFIPLTVGGGLRSIDDIRAVLRAGADKVALNTAAIARPELIREASREFGSSTIVVAIEAIRQDDGRYLVFTDNGRNHTGVEAISWARQCEELGAGEIFLTSVDREGTGRGFDLDLVRAVAAAVNVPVIAHGGAGEPAHVEEVIRVGADAVAIASVLHYQLLGTLPQLRRTETAHAANGNSKEGNVQFLMSGSGFARVKAAALPEIKAYLARAGIAVRVENTEEAV